MNPRRMLLGLSAVAGLVAIITLVLGGWAFVGGDPLGGSYWLVVAVFNIVAYTAFRSMGSRV